MGRRKKRRKRALLFILIMILAISGATYYYFFMPVVSNKYEVVSKINIKDTNYSYGLLEDKIVVLEGGMLKVFANEEKIESPQIESSNVEALKVYIVDNNIFLIDDQSGKIIVWDEQLTTIKKLDLKENILLIRQDKKNQYIGIHTKSTDGTERIMLIDKEGEKIGEIKGFKDGKVIDFTFDSEKEIIAISAMSYDQEYKTDLMITDLEGKIKGGRIFENEIISQVFLTNQGEIICVGTNRMIKLNESNEVEWENKIKVDKIGYSESNNALVLCDEGLTKTKVTLLSDQNEVLYEDSLDGAVNGIKGNNKRTILYGNRTICDITKSALSETKIYKDVDWADVREDGKIVMCNNKSIEVLLQKQ